MIFLQAYKSTSWVDVFGAFARKFLIKLKSAREKLEKHASRRRREKFSHTRPMICEDYAKLIKMGWDPIHWLAMNVLCQWRYFLSHVRRVCNEYKSWLCPIILANGFLITHSTMCRDSSRAKSWNKLLWERIKLENMTILHTHTHTRIHF